MQESAPPLHPREHDITNLERENDHPETQPGGSEQLQATPRVWIGSWLDYNDGVLHGEWIRADQPDEQLEEAVQAMLRRSPTTARYGDAAEDWGIFDFDNFGPLNIGEQESLAWVGAVGRGIAKHGPAFAAYADVVEDLDTLAGFEDDYLGTWESIEAYVESFADDVGYNQLLDEALPDSIRHYVRLDTAAIARDMQAEGAVHAVRLPEGSVAFLRREVSNESQTTSTVVELA